MSLLWMVATAFAGVPDGVRPVLAPANAPEQFAAWAAKKGQPELSLPCREMVAEHLLVCFRVREGEKRRWVHSADLAQWEVSADALAIEVSRRAGEHLEQTGSWTSIEGTAARYWLAAAGTGWEAGVFLRPELTRRALNLSSLFAAAPNVGVVLAWRGGVAEVDTIMAVGAREMHDKQPQRVSSAVYRWDGRRWWLWAEATQEQKP